MNTNAAQPPDPHRITIQLDLIRQEESDAMDRCMELPRRQLRRLAEDPMRKERSGHALPANRPSFLSAAGFTSKPGSRVLGWNRSVGSFAKSIHRRTDWTRLKSRALLAAIALVTLCASPITLLAQRRHVRHYVEADGLPSSSVFGITQDHHGVMWFATRAGVASYDGWKWTHHETAPASRNRSREFILRDRTRNLWTVVSTTPVRVCRFDGRAWKALAPHGSSTRRRITAFDVGQDGSSTLVAAGSGDGHVHVWCDGRWDGIQLAAAPAETAVRTVVFDGGRLLVATSEALLMLDPKALHRPATRIQNVPPGGVLGLARAADGSFLWVIGPSWIGRLEGDRFSLLAERCTIRPGPVEPTMVACPDCAGGLYFGNSMAVYHYRSGAGLSTMDRSTGLIAEGATALFLDHERNLWVGGLRGITKIVNSRIANYDRTHGLFEDEVSAICRRRSGALVLGHPAGITFWGDRPRTLRLGSDDISGRVLDIADGPDGKLWVAATRLGLASIDENGRVTWHEVGPEGVTVATIRFDRRGQLWVGTDKGLYRRHTGRFEQVPFQGQKRCYVRRIVEAPDGALFLGTPYRGLYRLEGDHVDHWSLPGEWESNNVYAALQMPDGTIWAGTGAGLFRAAGKTLVAAVPPGPVVDRPVYFIVRGPGGGVWLGTDNGVWCWRGERFHRFTVRNGLIGAETNRAAAVFDAEGALWVGTNRGLSVIRPRTTADEPVAPLAELLEIDVNGVAHPADRPLVLAAHSNTLIFRFRAISYRSESRMRYRAWLQDFEPPPVRSLPLTDRSIRYTNLPPGSYRFHLRIFSADGAASPEVVSAKVVISPPIWRRPWFAILAILAGLAMVLGAGYLIVNRRFRIKLERTVVSRTAALREAERTQKLESLGILAGGIAHDFNNLLTVMLGNLALIKDRGNLPPEAAERLKDALAATLRARSLTQQLLTFSKGGEPVRRAASLLTVIRESVALALSGSRTRAELDLPPDLPPVNIDVGQMTHVLNNLLINARQAMPDGGTIRIRARRLAASTEPRVEVTIKDEGIGIDEGSLSRVFDPYFSTKPTGSGLGLAIAHSVIKKHGGRITADSLPGRGATFTIVLPTSTEHPSDVEQPGPDTPTSTARILVMDDEPLVRGLVEQVLTHNGLRVVLSEHGEEAVQHYASALDGPEPFAVVILDLTVPGGMGGAAALRRLLEIDADVKAIVTSGYSDNPVLAEFKRNGFKARLMKPFSPDELLRVVRRVAAGESCE